MEITDRWFAIVNPTSGTGKGLRDWPMICKLLRDNQITPEFAFTERRYHATELAVEAVNNGFRKIMVVGGDGTIHEVVNGLFIQKAVPTTDILLSVVSVGTGNDWIRTFGIPVKYAEAIQAIVAGYSFLQDVGEVSYYESKYRQSRHIANVAGCGLDAVVNRRCNEMKMKGRSGRFLYLLGLAKAFISFHAKKMKIWVDDKLVVNESVLSATVGIGKYNGGGMIQVPLAIADDGLLDLTVIRRVNKLSILYRAKALYNGHIYDIAQVSHHRGRTIRIESVKPIELEADGEMLGESPFELKTVDKAIRVVVTEDFLAKHDN